MLVGAEARESSRNQRSGVVFIRIALGWARQIFNYLEGSEKISHSFVNVFHRQDLYL